MDGIIVNANNDSGFSNGIGYENENNGKFGLAPGAERAHFLSSSNCISNGNGITNGYLSNNNENVPGSSGLKPNINPEKVVMNYSVDFPKLPDGPKNISGLQNSVWNRQPIIESTEVTEALKMRASERALRNADKFGSVSDEQLKCNNIAAKTSTRIELCEAKDQSLTILITGKRQNVELARGKLVCDLKSQSTVEVSVPKEFHGHIIGQKGQKLENFKTQFHCDVFVPKRDENSNIIRISGPNEYVEKVARKIREIGDEAARQGSESIQIPKEFYPWIRGSHNENIENFAKIYPSVKINIPPFSVKNGSIIVTGERQDVDKVVTEIKNIYEKKSQSIKVLSCMVPKAQHRFIIGSKRSGIDEILKETDVSVEVPSEEEKSDSITLRGPPERLGDALALIYSKASSVISQEINYPEWMRRFLIGPKGATLRQLVPNQEKLKLEFEDGGVIYLEGAPEPVKAAYAALSAEVQRLNKELSSEVIKAPTNFYRYIIGRNGYQINKLKEDNGVQISIPDESTNSDEIRIEGNKEGVKNTVATIKEIIARLENEKTRDIIIEHRFHGQIIGKNGENVQKWRQQFPSVSVVFPELTEKSDIVTLRGDRKEVDELYKLMTKVVKELIESHYQESVSIFKDYYKHIIGKNGTNINRIREETHTRIELPLEGEGRITVIGKQANVEKAIQELYKIQNKLASIVTVEVKIPNKIHNRLLINGRRLIRDIEDECANVHIIFPKEKGSDIVTIRGLKDSVVVAEKTLKEVVKHCEATTEELLIPTKPEYIKFLIGKDGINVRKLREKYPSVRIVFPSESDKEKTHNILLLGKKEEVEAVKKCYEKQIADLKETVEISLNIDPKYHRYFIMRSAEVLKDIQNQNSCQISFPKQDSGESKVTIKGSKTCVEDAKQKIEEIVGDLEAQVTIDVEIPEVAHRSLRKYLNGIRNEYNVRIKMPENNETQNENIELINGVRSTDIIQITGRNTKCESAKEKLISFIPVTKSINVPIQYHISLIGSQGAIVRGLMNTYRVTIKIPNQNEKSEEILINGVEENVDLAIENIKNKIEEIHRQAEERRLRSFKTTLDVPLKYHLKLIGPQGSYVKKLSERHDCQVKIPHSKANSTTITLIGFENNVNECKEEIEQIILDLESIITQEISLNVRYHSRLIGPKGRNLRKVESEFGVKINLSGRNDPNPELVTIKGKTEDSVYNCANYLREQEENYIEELIDRGIFIPDQPKTEQVKKINSSNQQMEITGAPWQIDNMEQFPAMGASPGIQNTVTSTQSSAAGGVWGQRRW